MLLMVIPYAGLLSTILAEEGVKPKVFINIVVPKQISMRLWCKYLQIFNRHRLAVDDISCEDVYSLKDEVLLLNSCENAGVSDYMINQRMKKHEDIARTILNEGFITENGRIVMIPVVRITNRISRFSKAVNVFIDDDLNDNFLEQYNSECKRDIIGEIFYHFVCYCQENYCEIVDIVKEQRKTNYVNAWLNSIWNIMDVFWRVNGIDLKTEVGIPDDFRIESLLENDFLFEDDILKDFIKIIREEIKECFVVPKKLRSGSRSNIFYNDEYFWVPTEVLDTMLYKYGLQSFKLQFLAECKACGLLITDQEGYSRKYQVEGPRFETYQFVRGGFNAPGLVDIISLGREMKIGERRRRQ